jgi:diadenylate cyclase
MTTWQISFYSLAAVLFITLIWRIMKAHTPGLRTTFYLFLMLYLALFSSSFLGVGQAYDWSQRFCFVLFFLGEVWFLSEPISQRQRQRHEFKVLLKELKKEKGAFYEAVMGAHFLSQARLGALIAMERRKPLKEWYDKGVKVDALLSREILYSIFTPPGALHDGGAIIRKNRVVACGVIFPLTEKPGFPKELGTRHRAALGFSEVTDALCVVVSEESGTISLADRGSLYYDIPFERLSEVMERAFRFRLNQKKNGFSVQTFELAKA